MKRMLDDDKPIALHYHATRPDPRRRQRIVELVVVVAAIAIVGFVLLMLAS
jgi:hypothetical protein